MTRRCEITGKIRQVGNNVSHANNKNKRRFETNVQKMRMYSESLNRFISMRVSTAGLRTVEHNGGFDGWLLKQTPSKLTADLRKIRNQVEAAQKAAS